MKPSKDGSTVGLSHGMGAAGGRTAPRRAVPTLTVLCHPDLDRVGDRAPLPELARGGTAALSRQEPSFAPPGAASGAPLGDLHLSRKPLRLAPVAGGGVAISLGESRTRVAVDGEPLAAERVLSAAEVARGAVLELAGRVVVLLHPAASAGGPPAAERFGLVGDSDGIARVRAEVRRVADLTVPVLLRGESGTGKELVARALHDAGPRRRAPFVGVNLGAIPPSLAAAELFGAVRGAFTGAVRDQEGFFRRADGGTLFLDEIGEAPGEVQTMLLRTLETGEVCAVGSQALHHVDVRVIAATDSNLEERIRAGDFRAPLLHRLSGYEIWLPPLTERRDDIGRLLVHFLREEMRALGEEARLAAPADPAREPWLPAGLVARLALHPWPGNVRQLRNVARQLAIGSRGQEHLEIGPAVERLLAASPAAPGIPAAAPEEEAEPTAPRRRPAEVSEDELLAALRAQRWDLQATATALGISRTSLYALIEASPRARKAGDLTPEEIARCHRECGGDLEAMSERLQVSGRALGRRLRELGLVTS